MKDYFALLDNNYHEEAESYLYRNSVEWVTCTRLEDAEDCLKRVEDSKLHAVGFLSYELAKHFGYAAKGPVEGDVPLLQFGLFERCERLNAAEVDVFLRENFGDGAPFISDITPQTSPEKYSHDIARIKSELEAGNTYQVNYTFETTLKQGGCVFRLYDALRQAQPVPYGAFLNFPALVTLSRSPELFFEKQGARITCKPMKGTEPRSLDPMVDLEYRAHLVASPKQRAENLMIVDLLRNDLSRIAEFGSVKVEKLFEVERYKTVHQMTSTITAEVREKNLREILAALFPCGSITGAPKHITTEIITELEPHSRGIYCGAIGVHEPNGDMKFNVPIRTLMLEGHAGRFHIGGGVVYDSADDKEYDEALLKGKFLFDLPREFKLLDSHYYSPNSGARHWERHLARLQKSAKALRFPFDQTRLEDELQVLYERTESAAKIRIELSQSGEIDLEAVSLDEFEGDKPICLYPERIQSSDPIYAHKTTNRAFYNRAFQSARKQGAYDVIFANEHEHLTEAAIHNLVLRFGDEFVTPPLDAGVLPGIGREVFLDDNPQTRVENLPLSSLYEADEILLVSSVRGLVPVLFAELD